MIWDHHVIRLANFLLSSISVVPAHCLDGGFVAGGDVVPMGGSMVGLVAERAFVYRDYERPLSFFVPSVSDSQSSLGIFCRH